MDAVSLQAALLRAQLPDVTLRPGQKVVARVIEQQGGRGLISLAGATLAAQLPEEVEAGSKLRLQVDEVGPERVVLRTLEQAAVPLAVPLPLPTGEQAALRVDDEDEEQADARQGEGEAVALVYDTPRLGPLHLRLELTREAIRATVQARAGEPFELAEARAEELREALAAVTGREAAVTVRPRREPLDVYA
jgi:hypothetical protein